MGIATSLEEVATASAGDGEYTAEQERSSIPSEPAGNRFAAAVKAAQAAQGADGVPAQSCVLAPGPFCCIRSHGLARSAQAALDRALAAAGSQGLLLLQHGEAG